MSLSYRRDKSIAGNHEDDSGGTRGKDRGDSCGGEEDDDYKKAEFGPLLGFDMEAAKDTGIWEVLFLRYFDLQVLELLRILLEDVNMVVFSHSFDVDLCTPLRGH